MIRKKIFRFLIVLGMTVGLLLLCSGCQKNRDFDKLMEVEISRHGSMISAGDTYKLELESGKWIATHTYWYFGDEQVWQEPVDYYFAQKLKDLLTENRVNRWDGFDKNNSYITDGEKISFIARFSDGTSIEAQGYMAYPKNFQEVWDGFEKMYAFLSEE